MDHGDKKEVRARIVSFMVVVQRDGTNKYSGSEMPRWNVDNLITHVLAAALIVDDFECDVHDLKLDLKLENGE
jgi:hypothetical protein